MKILNIDIETYSEADLTKSGVYKYVDKTSGFEVLLFGYAVDVGPVKVIDLASGEQIPEEIVEAIKNPAVLKYAFNAQFERVCLGAQLDTYLAPDSWRCTMVASL
jgi:DNA polymerase